MTNPQIRFPEFIDDWKLYSLKDVLERVAKPVDVNPNILYKQIGIRSHGKGLFYKEKVTGRELGNKRLDRTRLLCSEYSICMGKSCCQNYR